MKLKYKIGEQDFLDFQLFTASQSDRIKRKMLYAWIFLIFGFGIVSGYSYFKDNIVLTIYFGLVAIICGLFYPTYFRWRYKKHYKTYIRENYANRFDELEYLEINNETIFSKDKVGESIISISEIEKIDETERHFFVKMSGGVSLIIPKYKIENPNDVHSKFELLGFSVNKTTSKKIAQIKIRFKPILIGLLILVLDIFIYLLLGFLLMNYEDFWDDSKGEFWSLASMNLQEKVIYLSFQVWNVINIAVIIGIICWVAKSYLCRRRKN